MIWFIIGIILLIIVFIYFYNLNTKLRLRLELVEKQVNNLSIISSYFPEFIEKGENLTKNISEELTAKQSVLKKLIKTAENSYEKLGYLEEKINENKLDQTTINKILILVNQGFKASDIAPKLNIPVGEIELVIKLRKYLGAPIKEKL